MSFVSFRRCKVTVNFSQFQEILQILLQLVWTNARSLDKSRKLAKKLSKGMKKARRCEPKGYLNNQLITNQLCMKKLTFLVLTMQRYGEFLAPANSFSESPYLFSKQDFK